MTKQNTPAIKKGDTVNIIGNLSKGLLALPEPRLGEVLNVNGAYIMVRPNGLNYDCEFLENEVRLAITATPTEVKEPEEKVITSKQYDSLPKEQRDLYEPHLGEYYYSSTGSEKATNRPWSEAKKYTGFCATVTHYRLIEVITPTTLLSEGKETVEQKKSEIHDLLVNYSAIQHMYDTDFWELVGEIIEWQSQHTAKEIEALRARVAEPEAKLEVATRNAWQQ